jgi:hypothetical protein
MKLIVLICLPVLLTSCYSYRINNKEYRDYKYHGERSYAYVTNPQMKKEYRILKKSGIFILTTDSLQPNCVKVNLQPLGHGFSCGMGIIPFIFTLGVLPGGVDNSCTYKFTVTKDTVTRNHAYFLNIDKRFWWPDLVSFRKNYAKAAGKVLRGNYYNNDLYMRYGKVHEPE